MKKRLVVAILLFAALVHFQFLPVCNTLPAANAADGESEPSEDEKVYEVAPGGGAISLEDLVVFIRDTLKIQIIYDKRIFSGDGVNYVIKVDPKPEKELLPFLRDTLKMYGYNLMGVGDEQKPIYYIYKAEGQPGGFKVPMPKILKEGETAEANQYVMRFVKLKYADASVLVSELQALKYQDGTAIQPINATNEIALVGFSQSVDFYMQVISNRDVEGAKLATVLVKLSHVKASFLKPILEQTLYAVGVQVSGGGDNKTANQSLVRITAIDDLNMLLCLVPEHKAEMIENLIKDLDEKMAPPEQEVITKVYALNYMDPDEAVKLIGEVFGGQTVNESAIAAESTSPGSPPPAHAPESGAPARSTGEASSGVGNFRLEEFEMPTITRLPSSTTLVITTSVRVHKKVQELLTVVDVKQPQVYLDAALVSVAYDSTLSIGTEWNTVNKVGEALQPFGGTNFGLSTFTPVPRVIMGGRSGFQKGPGLAFGIAKDDLVPVLIRLSQTTSKIKVLSNPFLFGNNGQESQFTTQDIRFFAARQTDVSGAVNITQGGSEAAAIEIKITPMIFDSNFVKLAITLKVEAFTGAAPSENVSPPKTSNVYTGTICVENGKSVVVGGLITTDENVTETKVPVLGDIPLLGYLFKSRTTTNDKAVLYVFITPRIVRTEEELREVERQKREKVGEIENAAE